MANRLRLMGQRQDGIFQLGFGADFTMCHLSVLGKLSFSMCVIALLTEGTGQAFDVHAAHLCLVLVRKGLSLLSD